jgi:hypothetical protein
MNYRLFTDFIIILQYKIKNFKSLNLKKGEKNGME